MRAIQQGTFNAMKGIDMPNDALISELDRLHETYS
jgi:hypothetical protein